jgi:arylsulfatase A-like enzyme
MAGGAGTASAERGAAKRPNLLFIMTDQQFGGAMSCVMGTDYLQTPVMDGLAAQGTLFTRAYVANPLCMPARMSIFTGKYPHETGVTKNARGAVDPDDLKCLGTYFREAGYETAYFGKWHLIFDEERVDAHGFETMGAIERQWEWDTAIREAAVAYLSEEREEPFLAVVSFLNPHDICEFARGDRLLNGPVGEAPALEACPPAPSNLAPPIDETSTMTTLRRAYQAGSKFPVGDFTAEDWRRQRWGYYRMIEMVDAEIGRVMKALRESGMEEDTVVIFSSDHGECAGAHRFNQKTVFYEESVRVPLIISRAGETSAAKSDELVNTGIDLIPTMLDFAGIAVPEDLAGRSLRTIVGGGPVLERRDHIVLENHLSQTASIGNLRPTSQGRLVRTDRYKYCVYDRGLQREALFDLEVDPEETKNVVGGAAYTDVVLDHRRILREFTEETNDDVAAEILANGVGPIPFEPEVRKKIRE